MFILNKQVKVLQLLTVKEYDEKLFTVLFYVANKIKIRKIWIQFHQSLCDNDVKNICTKISEKIKRIEIQNIASNDVSCFIKLL